MRHKHYTPGHFPANNNNSERFFIFMLLVSASFYHSCPGFDGMHSTENVSRQVLFENISVIFISKIIRQIFRRSLLLPIRIWCQILSLWILFEYSNFCFRQQPYSLSIKAGADLGGGCRECAPPPSKMTCSFLIQLVFCEKKTMWFIGVEVEQETSAPPPKKNPGSAPVKWPPRSELRFYLLVVL